MSGNGACVLLQSCHRPNAHHAAIQPLHVAEICLRAHHVFFLHGGAIIILYTLISNVLNGQTSQRALQLSECECPSSLQKSTYAYQDPCCRPKQSQVACRGPPPRRGGVQPTRGVIQASPQVRPRPQRPRCRAPPCHLQTA